MACRLSLFLSMMAVLLAGCRQSATSGPGVVLLRYNPGSQSTEQREKGFLETLAAEYPQIKVISADQYAGTTPESGARQSDRRAQQVSKPRHRGVRRV